MSIFKSEHRCPRTFRQIVRGWFGKQCESEIGTWYDGDYHFCTELSGHRGKHRCIVDGVRWGYGDNWQEMTGHAARD